MDAQIKKYLWAFKLSMISLVAFFGAEVVNHVALDALALRLKALAPQPAAVKKREKPLQTQRKAWARVIEERNLFNATPPSPEELAAKEAPVEADVTPQSALPAPYDECEASGVSASLKLTMVAEPSSASYAVITVGSEDRILREGDSVAEAQLVSIQWNGGGGRVVLNEKGSFKCLSLGQVNASRRPAAGAPPAPSAKPSGGGDDKLKDGIKEVSPGRYEVDRAMLDEQLADLDNIIRQARVIPHYSQGKPAGFKVVGIRSNSIFRHLGLKSGDVLKSVGGEELTSINKALSLFDKLKTSDNVAIDIERLGKPSTFEYNIR
jgi:general secretion pathway protein C